MREHMGFGETAAAASYPPDDAFRQSGATGDKSDWPNRHELAERVRKSFAACPVCCEIVASHMRHNFDANVCKAPANVTRL